MSNGRTGDGRRNRRDTGRDAGGFVALPLAVLQSAAYLELSHPARSLLLEVAMQYSGGDNGRMLLSTRHLAARGWKSHDVVQRAKQELIDAQLIFETVKGMRPSKATWYAVTWRALDPHFGYDAGAAASFQRGAYQNARLIPSGGIAKAKTVPSHGIETPPPIPSDGAVAAVFGGSSIPSDGNPLDLCHLQHRAADAGPACAAAAPPPVRPAVVVVGGRTP